MRGAQCPTVPSFTAIESMAFSCFSDHRCVELRVSLGEERERGEGGSEFVLPDRDQHPCLG